MRHRYAVLAVLAAGLPAPGRAQQPVRAGEGDSPAACVQQANQWRTQQYTEARAAQQPVDAAALLAEARRRAAECGARFRVETTPPARLAELAALYNYTGEVEQARAAVQRALGSPELGARQRGDLLLLAVGNAFAGRDAFAGINEEAEQLVKQVDALPDSLVDLKIRAHQTVLGRYGYGDVDDGIQAHALALLELGRKAGPKGRFAMIQGYADLARAAADFLKPDSAFRLLAQAEREFGVPLDSIAELADARDRYALAGTPAAAVTGEIWLNADPPPAPVVMNDGKVRLVQFTAHWCAPCRNSYPGMLRLAERFAGRPFEVVFVTELYGNFEGRPATEAEELAADRVYYAKHHIPFRIAVNRYLKPAPGANAGFERTPLVNRQYQVGGIPQIVLVDRQGTIRQIVVGWDRGNEQRLGGSIEELLRQ